MLFKTSSPILMSRLNTFITLGLVPRTPSPKRTPKTIGPQVLLDIHLLIYHVVVESIGVYITRCTTLDTFCFSFVKKS